MNKNTKFLLFFVEQNPRTVVDTKTKTHIQLYPTMHHHHYHPPFASPDDNFSTNLVTLCGPSRSKCGYCQGSRVDILSTPNPPLPQLQLKQQQQTKQPTILNPIATDQSNPKSTTTSPTSKTNSQDHLKVTPNTSSKAYSVLASSITPQDYQQLLDYGWRRSGELLYLPQNWESCCPCHPIRLDVNKFQPSKSHLKVIKNLNLALHKQNEDDDHHHGKQQQKQQQQQQQQQQEGNHHENGNNHDIANGETKKGKLFKKFKPFSGRKRARKNQQNATETTAEKLAEENDTTVHTTEMTTTISAPPSLNIIHDQVRTCIISNSGIIPILKQATIDIVRNYITQKSQNHHLQQQQQQQQNNGTNDIKLNQTLKKCSTYKITKISKPQHICMKEGEGEEDKEEEWNYDITVTLTTSICPALHGASRGDVDKVLLSKYIANALEEQQDRIIKQQEDLLHPSKMSSLPTTDAATIAERLEIVKISCHKESSHVIIILKVSNCKIGNNYEQQDRNYNNAATYVKNNNSNDNDNDNRSTNENRKIDKREKIQSTITNYIESLMNQDKLSLHQYQNIHPPYKLTVRSIPARISGRDPKVHRLFTKYQAGVHNDKDPFMCGKKERNDDHVKMKKSGEKGLESEEILEELVVDKGKTGKLKMKDFERLYQNHYDALQTKAIYKR